MHRLFIAISILLFLTMHNASAGENCSTSPPTITFPTYYTTNASATTVTASLPVTCITDNSGTRTVSYTVTFSAGSSGSSANRRMANGGNTLNYNIYKNSGYSQIYGNGTGGTVIISNAYSFITSRTDNYAIYSKIPALQNVYVGNYSDSVSVTVTW